jgi:hypothetical protein
MLTIALLWYDDDTRRPLPQKILDATARYRERLGAVPTVCHLNPAQAEQALHVSPRKKPEPLPVRLEPDDTMRPNYFLVGLDDADAPAQPLPVPDVYFAESEEPPQPRRAKAGAAASGRTRAPRRETATRQPVAGRVDAKPRSKVRVAPPTPPTVELATRRHRRQQPAADSPATPMSTPATLLPAPRPRNGRRSASLAAAPIAFQPTLLESSAKQTPSKRTTPSRGRARRAS